MVSATLARQVAWTVEVVHRRCSAESSGQLVLMFER